MDVGIIYLYKVLDVVLFFSNHGLQIVFAGGCSQLCACASGNWTPTKSTQYSSTSCRLTTNGTDTRITSHHGWLLARRTPQPHIGCTRTRIHRSRAISCTKLSCRLKRSNLPTTRWTSVDRWVQFLWFILFPRSVFRKIFIPRRRDTFCLYT